MISLIISSVGVLDRGGTIGSEVILWGRRRNPQELKYCPGVGDTAGGNGKQ